MGGALLCVSVNCHGSVGDLMKNVQEANARAALRERLKCMEKEALRKEANRFDIDLYGCNLDRLDEVCDIFLSDEAILGDLYEEEYDRQWMEPTPLFASIVVDGYDAPLDPEMPIASITQIQDNATVWFCRKACEEPEQIAKLIRENRTRKSQRRTCSKMRSDLSPQDIQDLYFSIGMITKLAAALREGNTVTGWHSATIKTKSGGTFVEQGWSWTLFFSTATLPGKFVWSHRERKGGAYNALVVDETWDTDDDFIEWWSNMSERTMCAYTGFLIYSHNLGLAKLEGTPRAADFDLSRKRPIE
jgi:hypothetical protein